MRIILNNLPYFFIVKDLQKIYQLFHYYCAPSYLINYFQNDINLCYSLRSGKSKNFVFKLPFTEFYKHSFAYSGIQLWNNLPESVKLSSTIESFKHKCKLYISHNVTMSLVKVFSTDCFIYMYNYNCDCEGPFNSILY